MADNNTNVLEHGLVSIDCKEGSSEKFLKSCDPSSGLSQSIYVKMSKNVNKSREKIPSIVMRKE
jgi:hypothetical protein